MTEPFNSAGWIPSRFVWKAFSPQVQWILLRRQRLLDPFYEQTLAREMMHPFNHLFRLDSTVEQMVDWMSRTPSLSLKGLIFHMSRCGSTLIAQMLASSERNIVAAEPPPFDGILQARLRLPDLPRATHIQWIRSMARALGQPRGGGEQDFFMKLDCWHAQHAGLLREAFPDVPFLFLYRDPVEVMVSHARMPAAWTVPTMLNTLTLLLQADDWDPQSKEEYCAKALANICEGGLDAAQRHGALLLNYTELPNAMFGRVYRHFGLTLDQIPAMAQQTKLYSKSPQEQFQPDSSTKQSEATGLIRSLVAKYLLPVYNRLEAERARQISCEHDRC